MAAAGASWSLDDLDLALLTALAERPRIGDLELSRVTRVARATVASRLRRLEQAGVIADWSPTVDVEAAGFGLQAFVTLEIAQGALEHVADELTAIPAILEAWATTGTGDVLCRVAAASHQELQATLVELNRSSRITRSTSVMVLSELVAPRVLPLLATGQRRGTSRAPAYRHDHAGQVRGQAP